MEFNLRAWNLNDVDSLTKHANNNNISKYLTNKFPYPYTKENAISFINLAMSFEPQAIFCIDINNEAVGGIGVHVQNDIHCKNAELGYWLAEPFWNKGIITKAIPKVVEYGFTTFDINRIYARVFENNPKSSIVLEKNGFIKEGYFEKTIFKNNEFLNETIFAIRK